MTRHALPKALTIAGSDSGGGAGIQADLKTFAALEVFGTSAITAVTAQHTRGVTGVHALPPEMVRAQIDAVAGDIGTHSVKIGMLANAGIVSAVAAAIREHALPLVVLDPVMVAASGDPLLDDDAVSALAGELLPLADVVTPNTDEASLLTGQRIHDLDSMKWAAGELLGRGAGAVLVKGGHLDGAEVVDFFATGDDTVTVINKRLPVEGHGTGCTLSSALAAYLARGLPLTDALHEATAYVHEALRHGYRVGAGEPVVLEHFWPQRIGP